MKKEKMRLISDLDVKNKLEISGEKLGNFSTDPFSHEQIGWIYFAKFIVPIMATDLKSHGYDGIFLGKDNKLKFFEAKLHKSSLKTIVGKANSTIEVVNNTRKDQLIERANKLKDGFASHKWNITVFGKPNVFKIPTNSKESLIGQIETILESMTKIIGKNKKEKRLSIKDDNKILWIGLKKGEWKTLEYDDPEKHAEFLKKVYGYGVLFYEY